MGYQVWTISYPQMATMHLIAICGAHASILSLICPSFHSLGNATHSRESDKANKVGRSVKLEVMNTNKFLPGECGTLAHDVDKLLVFLPTEMVSAWDLLTLLQW